MVLSMRLGWTNSFECCGSVQFFRLFHTHSKQIISIMHIDQLILGLACIMWKGFTFFPMRLSKTLSKQTVSNHWIFSIDIHRVEPSESPIKSLGPFQLNGGGISSRRFLGVGFLKLRPNAGGSPAATSGPILPRHSPVPSILAPWDFSAGKVDFILKPSGFQGRSHVSFKEGSSKFGIYHPRKWPRINGFHCNFISPLYNWSDFTPILGGSGNSKGGLEDDFPLPGVSCQVPAVNPLFCQGFNQPFLGNPWELNISLPRSWRANPFAFSSTAMAITQLWSKPRTNEKSPPRGTVTSVGCWVSDNQWTSGWLYTLLGYKNWSIRCFFLKKRMVINNWCYKKNVGVILCLGYTDNNIWGILYSPENQQVGC